MSAPEWPLSREQWNRLPGCLSDCKAGPTSPTGTVRRLSLAGSAMARALGAMRFVARRVFKRVRAGHLLRKVAVFFKAGPTRDAGSISTTRLSSSVLDITAVVITFTEDHNLPDVPCRGGRTEAGQVQGLMLTLWGVRAGREGSPETGIYVCVGLSAGLGMSHYRLCCQRNCWCPVASLEGHAVCL